MNFSLEFFLIPDEPVTKFIDLNAQHFQDAYDIGIYNAVETVDLASEEVQLKIIDFYDKIERCYLCYENWFKNHFHLPLISASTPPTKNA